MGSRAGADVKAASLDNRGTLSAVQSLTLKVSGKFTNEKNVGAGSTLQIDADALDNSGKLFSHGSLLMRIGGAALNSGKIGADGTVDFRAASLVNGGALYSLAKSVDVQTRESFTNSGTVEARQFVSLKAAALNNSGAFTAEGAVKLALQQGLSNTGEIGANGTLTLTAATLDNRGRMRSAESSLVLATEGKTSNQGKILAATRLEITATGIDNNDGTLAGNEVVIDTRKQRFNNQRGVLFARQDLRLESADLDNSLGTVAARGKLTISSGAINNERGQLQSQGAMRVEVSAGSVDNRRGLIRSDEDVTLQSQRLRNDDTQGKDQGIEGRSVSLTAGALYNNNGAIRTGQSLQIAASESVDNRGGLLSSQGTLSVNDPASTRRLVIDNEGGRIPAGGDLSLTSHSLIGKGLLLSHRNLRIDVVTDLEQRGETVAGGDLDLRTDGRFSNYGTLAAGAALRVTARGFQNHAGASILGGDVSLSAGAGQDFINRGLIDGITTRIQAGTLYNLGTGRIYGDRVALAADVLHNASETIDGVLRAPVIAARERLDIGTGVLYNSEQALLYSVGDVSIGGAIGSDHRATGRAREVNNTSATVNADGALTIAADAINNRNAHFEIAEESKPGRRIINYRLPGSPDFVSGDNARLIHQDSGQIIAPENWRAMGDEDNFRLLLPSEEYPFDRYGPPFDYSRYVRRRDTSDSGVGVDRAYLRPLAAVSTESSSFEAEPERFVYQPEDRIWDVFGLARPTAPIPPEPAPPKLCSVPDSCRDADYRRRYGEWKAIRDAQFPFHDKLDKAILKFNRSIYARMAGEWIIYDGTEQIRRTIVTRSAPGMITSGGAMTLAAGVVNNYASQFIAGGVLAGDGISGTAINNTGPLGRQTVTSTGTAEKTFIKSHRFKADDRRYESAPYASQTIETQFPLDVSATHEAGSTRERTPRTPATVPAQALPDAGKTADLRAPAVDVSLPANALYQVNQSSVAAPLVQTDPRFIGQRNWLSSDFLVRAYQDRFGPAPGYQRFGDGFYEQQLIQRQIQEATGQRYLNGFSNNEAQYLALMQAGLQQAQVQRYALGIALSEAQIAQLRTDIVWLVQRRVTLADGREQEVLVPQVYLQPSSLRVSGRQTLIAGNEVAFQTVQDILNRGGTIAARSGVTLRADNVRNLGGRIEGGSVRLLAPSDIENAGGVIDANDKLVLSAGRDVVLRSTSVTTANAITTGRNIDQVASVSGKGVVLLAGRDLQADAAVIAASGDAVLAAGRDVRLGVVQEYFRQEIRWADDQGGSNWVSRLTGPNLVDRANGAHGTSEVGINRAVVTGNKEVATQVSGNSIRIQAGQDVTSKGAQVVAENALQVEAARDIHIGTANVSASARDQGQRSSSGILTARTVRTDDASSTSREAGSTFSGETVLVRSGNDVNVKGSQIVSTQGTTIMAGRDVNIVAASESSSQRNFRQETTSGVMGAGIGVTVGSRMQSRDVDRNSEAASASTIGSVQGDVRIVAGNRYTQVGSDVLAPGGDIDIVARTVSILAAQQSSRTVTEDKFRQQGVTVAVTSPVLSAVQTVQQMAEAASKTKSGRMQALAAANIGFAGKQAYDAISAGQGSTINDKPNQIATGPADAQGKVPSRDANAVDKVGGVNLAFSIGGNSSNSRSEQSSKTVRGSVVAAAGNVNIKAQGGGKDSSILVQGSDVKAGVNATLQAQNEIRLLADQNTSAQNSSNQSKSGSVGFSIGTDGFLVNANASGSRGRDDGSDVEQVNTHVDAGNKVELRSGTDTTLRGAVVAGRRVEIDAGTSGHGDLNIESLQDSSNAKSKQQGFGASVSVGAGKMNGSINLSRSRVEGEFASVNEQSGVRAGDEGFQVRVEGNTDLKGGKIASTDKAAIEGRNSLSTETLTQSDIQNRSSYKAESISVGAELNGAKGSLAGTGIGIGSSSGNESSVTRSGISAADVRIKDDLAQQAKTGKSAAETIASINTDVSSARDTSGKLSKQWDAQALQEDVQAQARIMEAFGRNASREIGRYATTKVNELDRKIDSVSEAERPALIAERDKWSEGGLYRTALHAAAGTLSGGTAGGAGALTASAVMPEFGKLIDKMALPAPVRQGLEQVTAAAIGSVAGGSAGLAAAVNAEANNRQLHRDEKSVLSRLQEGKSDVQKQRLADAACAMTRCSAAFSDENLNKAALKESEERGNKYFAEQLALNRSGLFKYGDRDSVDDQASRLLDAVKEQLASAGRGAVNLAYLIGRNGPNALPPILPDIDPMDSDGPSGRAGALVTPSIWTCALGRRLCVVTRPMIVPTHIYASKGDSDLGEGGANFNKRNEDGDTSSSIRNSGNLSSTTSPALKNSPYSPDNIAARTKPRYQPNPAHDKSSPLFNPAKTPEPLDAQLVYETSAVRGGMGTWYAQGQSGYYRYFYDNAGSVHFSGTVPAAQVPSGVLKLLGK
nr:hemagglutinin repeat-containing protein [Herbaspirillum sp. WGmk3]